ncbi:MAG: hypothetical protein HY744_11045 [Deltaproteobacteria bacterium]|nr:hypothetical protein [Deltaproteobacteria bacterium]
MATCKGVLDKQAACADDWINKVLDIRVEAGWPAPADRAALVEQGKKEMAELSAPDKREERCKKILEEMPAQEKDADVAGASACLAKADCKEFVACFAPIAGHSIVAKVEADKKADAERQAQATAACTSMMDKAVSCKDPFVEMLVDLRAELDFPKGIAKRAKSFEKPKLLADAKKELATDFADPKRTETCGAMAKKIAQADIDAVKACVAKADCKEFAACLKPTQKKMFEAQQAEAAKAEPAKAEPAKAEPAKAPAPAPAPPAPGKK